MGYKIILHRIGVKLQVLGQKLCDPHASEKRERKILVDASRGVFGTTKQRRKANIKIERENRKSKADKADKKAKVTSKRDRNRVLIKEYKQAHPCKMCGEKDVKKLTFHHRNPAEKIRNISSVAGKWSSWENIMKEVKKCDVLCRDCHDKVHDMEKKNVAI